MLKPDEMRRPASGRDAVYAPKLSTCSEAQEIKGDRRCTRLAPQRQSRARKSGRIPPWISGLLSELGHEVRLIGESRKKDDRLIVANARKTTVATRRTKT